MVFENKIIWNFDIHKIVGLLILLFLLYRGEIKVDEYLTIQEDKVRIDNLRLNNEIRNAGSPQHTVSASGDILGPTPEGDSRDTNLSDSNMP